MHCRFHQNNLHRTDMAQIWLHLYTSRSVAVCVRECEEHHAIYWQLKTPRTRLCEGTRNLNCSTPLLQLFRYECSAVI